MKIILSLLVSSLLAVTANAGPEQIIKQRAKDTANQNNARQGVPPAANNPQRPPGTPPAAAKPLPPDPTAKVRADLTALAAATKASPELKQTLANDLMALARGSTKPSGPTLNKFASQLADALAGKSLDASPQTRLVEKLNLLLNSASLSTSRAQEVSLEVKKLLENAGVPANTADTLQTALDAVVAEVQTK
jgi:hypothetical protein